VRIWYHFYRAWQYPQKNRLEFSFRFNFNIFINFVLKMKAVFVILFAFILALIEPAAAAKEWDAGDTIALLLGLVLGIVGICAALGWWARRRGEV
jgi:nitrate reductase gamma subunit